MCFHSLAACVLARYQNLSMDQESGCKKTRRSRIKRLFVNDIVSRDFFFLKKTFVHKTTLPMSLKLKVVINTVHSVGARCNEISVKLSVV
jgi:hypothetical protein